MPGWMNTGYLVTILERTEFGLDYCFVAFFFFSKTLLTTSSDLFRCFLQGDWKFFSSKNEILI